MPGNAKKIYDYLNKAGGQVGTFATNPLWRIADGPFVLSGFSSVNSSRTAKANPSYGGSPKPSIDSLHGVTYTGITPMLNAMRTGTLDVGSIDFSQLASVPGLRSQGYSVFGLPSFGWAGVIWNFKDTTNHFDKIISQLYFRQAMAMLVNQPAIIKGIFHGAAGLAYGPIPSVPKSPYVPPTAVNPPYPYNPAKAAATLKTHGWHVVPNGQTTCAKAGSGANECGARDIRGNADQVRLVLVPPDGRRRTVRSAHRRGRHLRGQAGGRDQRRAAPEDVQLHRHQPQRRRSVGGEVHECVGGRELQRVLRQRLSDAERDLQHRRSTAAPTWIRTWTS